MAYTYYNVLKQLMPLEMGGDFDTDLAIEGGILDTAKAALATLLTEMFPDTTTDLIDRWERQYGINPVSTDSLTKRRSRLVAKFIEKANLSRRYYIALAAAMGYTITIDEGPEPFRAGISAAGDPVYSDGVVWTWTVHVTVAPATIDRDDDGLEAKISELKPAHTAVTFVWAV